MNVEINIDKRTEKLSIENVIESNWKTIEFIDENYFSDIKILFEHSYTENVFVYYTLFSNYFLSMETLFSLLCAIAQAPHFVYGWLLKYKNMDLYNVVEKIHQNKYLQNSHNKESLTWEDLSNIIHPNVKDENDITRNQNFAQVWEKLANDFLTKSYQKSYNSIKHGFRAKKNAITKVNIGDREFCGSDYGFEYGIIERKKLVNHIKYQITNFNPDVFKDIFEFAKCTIFNIKNFLKAVNHKGKVNIEQYQLDNIAIKKLLNMKRPTIISLSLSDTMA